MSEAGHEDEDGNALEPPFPLAFVVDGTPLSYQSRSGSARTAWKEKVREASRSVRPEGHWQTARRPATTLDSFPDSAIQGDVDNIVKLGLDALGAVRWMPGAVGKPGRGSFVS